MKNVQLGVSVGALWGLFALVAILTSPVALADDNNSHRTVQRSVDEFLAAQAMEPDGGWWGWWPPTPDYNVGWVDPNQSLFALVDFSGLVNDWIVAQGGASLGTTVQGTITERPLKDGRAMVSVILHTKNALTFVTDFAETDWPGPFVFGHEAWEVLLGAEAGLAECTFKMEFINPAPGHPLPNVIDLLVFENAEEGQEVISVAIHARAAGPLVADDYLDPPDRVDVGPGMATVHQVAVHDPVDGSLVWIVEKIRVRATGP